MPKQAASAIDQCGQSAQSRLRVIHTFNVLASIMLFRISMIHGCEDLMQMPDSVYQGIQDPASRKTEVAILICHLIGSLEAGTRLVPQELRVATSRGLNSLLCPAMVSISL